MPLKPAKYSLNVFWLCDASNVYPLKRIFNAGKHKRNIERLFMTLPPSVSSLASVLCNKIKHAFLKKWNRWNLDRYCQRFLNFTRSLLSVRMFRRTTKQWCYVLWCISPKTRNNFDLQQNPKASVDTMAQMCMNYSAQQSSFTIFCISSLLLRTFITTKKIMTLLQKKTNKRRLYLRQHSGEPVLPMKEERASN